MTAGKRLTLIPARDKSLAYGAAITAAALIGSIGIFVRNISADATIIAFARLSLGFVFLLGFLALTGNLRAARVSIAPSLVASGLSLGLCVWSYIEAIHHMPLANAVFLLYLGPLMAVGLAPLLLGEKITLRSIALISLAFLGCLLIFRFNFSFSGEDASGPLYGAVSALCYALIIITNRKISPQTSPLGGPLPIADCGAVAPPVFGPA